MDLYFIGTHHHDPLGRAKLKNWLQEIKNQRDPAPAFIAVECEEVKYQSIEEHREKFKQCLLTKYPCGEIPTEVLDDLVLSLGYECDCHQQIFPNSPTLWLDDGITKQDAIDKYAENSFDRLLRYTAGLNDFNDLSEISKWVWNRHFDVCLAGGCGIQKDDRNELWAQKILDETKVNQEGWAIIIVGIEHTLDVSDSVKSRLETSACVRIADVKVLCPESLQPRVNLFKSIMEQRSSHHI